MRCGCHSASDHIVYKSTVLTIFTRCYPVGLVGWLREHKSLYTFNLNASASVDAQRSLRNSWLLAGYVPTMNHTWAIGTCDQLAVYVTTYEPKIPGGPVAGRYSRWCSEAYAQPPFCVTGGFGLILRLWVVWFHRYWCMETLQRGLCWW